MQPNQSTALKQTQANLARGNSGFDVSVKGKSVEEKAESLTRIFSAQKKDYLRRQG